MEVTEQEISNIFEWLRNTKHVTVNGEWLEACISWLKSRVAPHSRVNMQLENGVYEQLLLSDLSESGSNSLQDELSSVPKTSLQGFTALQMNSVVNVGESAYSQTKKLTDENGNQDITTDENMNQTWQPKPCRMLMLELTDGTQTIQGMEYQPMKKLNSDLIPGTKILVKGGTLCRSGMLFLTDNNIEILGGKVENLIEENSQINILRRLVRNAKDGETDDCELAVDDSNNERIQNNIAGRRFHCRLNQSREQPVNPPQQGTTHNNGQDFEAMLSEDDDFLAELDTNLSTDAHPTQAQTDFIVIDDDIPDDVLSNLNAIENILAQDNDIPDDVLLRSLDESETQHGN